MTSAATQPARGMRGRHAEGHGLVIIAADVVALYGLCAHGGRASLEAA